MQMENIQGRQITITVSLTPREQEIAGFISAGLTNMQIASKLGIAHQTVQTHVDRIRCKLGTTGCTRVVLANVLKG